MKFGLWLSICILILAANTSYADFPRLASVLAPAPQSSSSSDRGQSAPVLSYRVTPAPAPSSAQSAPESASSGGLGYASSALDDIPGVPQSFAACVALCLQKTPGGSPFSRTRDCWTRNREEPRWLS